MSEMKKFTEEELDKVNKLQSSSAQIILELGDAELQIFLINEDLEKLHEIKSQLHLQYKNLRSKEVELVTELNEKYGIGTVDINTGEFIPKN